LTGSVAARPHVRESTVPGGPPSGLIPL